MEYLNRYKPDKKLGEGAFGTVYKAFDKVLETYVAIKVISREGMQYNYNKLRKINREIKIPRILGCHINIVCVLKTFKTNTELVIVSEYIEGSTDLRDFKFPLEDKLTAINILLQLTEGLIYMHDKYVIHRDIKPENIIMKGNVPMYIDFDLSCVYESLDDFLKCGNRIVGTPDFIAPEVLMKEEGINFFRTDIYSLGIVFYELMNKTLPFESNYINKLLNIIAIRNTHPSYSKEYENLNILMLSTILKEEYKPSNSGIEKLDNIIMSMIKKPPKERATLAAVKVALIDIYKSY